MSTMISQAISQLILPPGGLILLAAIGIIFWQRLWGRTIVILSLALLWLLATEPVRDLLLSPLEQNYPPLSTTQLRTAQQGNSVIVVLGGGLYEHAPEYGGEDSLHGHSLMRTLYAANLAIKSGFEVYVSSGPLKPGTSEPEAVVMARMLARFGVQPEHIHTEARARTTKENGMYIKEMLSDSDKLQVILVTTAWHMTRSVQIFESLGIKVIPAPCNYQVEDKPYDLRSFLPRWNVLADSGDGLHEYLGILWYRFSRD